MKRAYRFLGIAALGAGIAFAAAAQNGPSPAHQAVEVRQSIYTLIGANFGPLGGVVKGTVPYDAAKVPLRTARLTMLAGMLDEAFPDVSNVGAPETKAKPEIWTNRADFDKKLKDFQNSVAALAQAEEKDKSGGEAFKTAVAAVGNACKACHENYRAK